MKKTFFIYGLRPTKIKVPWPTKPLIRPCHHVRLPEGVESVMHLCLVNFITPPQIEEQSIVMTVSVCLSTSIFLEVHVQSLRNFCACYLWPWLGLPLVA